MKPQNADGIRLQKWLLNFASEVIVALVANYPFGEYERGVAGATGNDMFTALRRGRVSSTEDTSHQFYFPLRVAAKTSGISAVCSDTEVQESKSPAQVTRASNVIN